jgi:hypothetical protein
LTILFVCHDTKRTESLFHIARALLPNDITILAVGKAAKNVYDNLPETDPLKTSAKMVDLGTFFSQDEIDQLEENPLTPEQLFKIKKDFLNHTKISKVIIGAPSSLKAYAPYQIAEVMAPLLTPENAYLYDGDCYQDLGGTFWTVLVSPEKIGFDWRKKFTLLLPLPATKTLVERIQPNFKHISVVGDPSVDIALNKVKISAEEKQSIFEVLQIPQDKALLLVAGTKVIEDDVAMIKNILKQKPSDTTQIRVQVHPECPDVDAYTQAILNLIKTEQVNTVKVIIESNQNDVDDDEWSLVDDNIIVSPIKRSALISASDGLACVIANTEATQAAIYGIPTYYDKSEQTSYLPTTRINTGEAGLIKFIAATELKQSLPTLNRTDLGLTQDSTVALVTTFLSLTTPLLSTKESSAAIEHQIWGVRGSSVVKFGIYATLAAAVGTAAYWQYTASNNDASTKFKP